MFQLMCRRRVWSLSAKSVVICIDWSRLVSPFRYGGFRLRICPFFVISTAISSQALYGTSVQNI
jgi:hypothetical protein